jgi:hypothetical protein
VQPAIGAEISGRNEEKSGSVVGILTRKQREIHVLADLDTPFPFCSIVGRAVESEACGSGDHVRLKGWQHVVLFIGAFETAVRRVKPGLVQVRLVLKGDE